MPVNKFRESHMLRKGYKKLASPPDRPAITPALIQHREAVRRKNKRKAPPPPRPPITVTLRRHREMLHRQQKRKAPPPPRPKRRKLAINSWTRI